MNRLSQYIACLNTQWYSGITGSEGYGIGFCWWGLVLQLLCLHPLKGIVIVSKEVGCCLIFMSISDKGLKVNLAGNRPGSYGTCRGTWLWVVRSPQISVCSMLPFACSLMGTACSIRSIKWSHAVLSLEKGSSIRKRSFCLSACVNRLNPSLYFFTVFFPLINVDR